MIERIEIPHNSGMQHFLDQLKVTHGKISIFDLLQLSKSDRDTLIDALKKIEVDVDIPTSKFVE